MVDKRLELHQALSEAEVEHQKAFDALRKFDEKVLRDGITDFEKAVSERKLLEDQESLAKDKKQQAWLAYSNFLHKSA